MIKAGFYNTRENVGCKQTLDNLQLLEKLASHRLGPLLRKHQMN